MWQRCFSLSLGLLVGSAVAQSPAPRPQSQSRPFLIGADWKDDASPAVKDLFWETGCNFARITGGGYDWAVDSHRHALGELDKHGIRVLLQLGSHYPSGRFFDFAEAFFVDQNGKTGVPNKTSWAVEYDGQSWPQYSYASDKFRSELEKDFTNYFDKLGALKNVEVLMLHNEPGYFWLDKRVFDYNSASIDRFRAWLPSQHRSITDLNRRWGSSYASFDRVDAPREIPPTSNPAPWMDWRRSNEKVIENFLSWEHGFATKRYPGIPTTTNLAGPIDDWYPVRLADNFGFSNQVDIAAVDIYPGFEWTSRFFPSYTMDLTRGAAAGKRIVVAECESYAPERFSKLTDSQRADRFDSDLWTYIGHGANGILVWSLNGQDGFRLTNGEYNARMAALRETAHVSKMLNLGSFTKPARKVALVIDQNSSLLPSGHLEPHAWADRAYKTALGLYGLLVQAHFEVDVITADMIRKGAGTKYRALVLAMPKAVDSELAQQLTKFVESGGFLLTDGAIGCCDRWGMASPTRPSQGLSQLFGVQVQPDERALPCDVVVGNNMMLGQDRTLLTVMGGDIWGRYADGTPAVIHKKVGKGNAVLVATNFGITNAMTVDLKAASIVGDWIHKCAGISPEIEIQGADQFLDALRLVDASGNELIVVTNPPNKSDPVTPYLNLHVRSTKAAATNPSFLLAPATTVDGRTLSGPRQLKGSDWLVPKFSSHATILTAANHSALLATSSPNKLEVGKRGSIVVTVFNPSAKPLQGRVDLEAPTGWTTGKSALVKMGPFGQATVTIPASTSKPFARAVLKAVFVSVATRVESIPFDIDVR